jgi:hypothetical protein
MIEAVLKNKLKLDEDCLTSTVWGLLKYQALRPILARFLARSTLVERNEVHLGKKISERRLKAGQVKILFWRAVSPFGEPDILLVGENFALVVEVKYNAKLSGPDQLRKYWKLLNEKYPKKKHHVIYLTKDWVTPRLNTAGMKESLWWLSWHELSLVVGGLANKNSTAGEIREDLIRFLDHLGLSFYRGLSQSDINLPDKIFWQDRVPIISQYESQQPITRYFWKEKDL